MVFYVLSVFLVMINLVGLRVVRIGRRFFGCVLVVILNLLVERLS